MRPLPLRNARTGGASRKAEGRQPASSTTVTPILPDDAEAWADRLQARLNDSEAFATAATGFDAAFRFDIMPDERYDGDPVLLTVVVRDGVCVAAAGADASAEYDFALRGPYGAWRDLLRGETDVSAAVMDGPFDFEGSTAELLQHRDAVTELVRAAQSVETEFAH